MEAVEQVGRLLDAFMNVVVLTPQGGQGLPATTWPGVGVPAAQHGTVVLGGGGGAPATGAAMLGGSAAPATTSPGVVMLGAVSGAPLAPGEIYYDPTRAALSQQLTAQAMAQFQNQLVLGGGAATPSTANASPVAGGAPAAASGAPATYAPGATGATGSGATYAQTTGSAIPVIGAGGGQLTLGRGQTTYRQLELSGGAAGTTLTLPSRIASGGVTAEVYVVRPFQRGSYRTDVLVPAGGSVQLAPGETVRIMVRVNGQSAGQAQLDIGGVPLSVSVSNTAIKPMAMMTWVNDNNAQKRGATGAQVEGVLQHFGVASNGAGGAGARSSGSELNTFFLSAAWEAKNRTSVTEMATRILQTESSLRSRNGDSELWVQVSDEQDQNAQDVAGTVQWISQLRAELARRGSSAKLFVAAQAQPWNLAYGSVVDGWATTQSSARNTTRDTARQLIAQASAQYGRPIEMMQYPGNAFFDGDTPGSAAVSVASAGLDGADTWYVFAANNQDTLESGQGIEGRGNIGGLVAIDNGSVLATLALAEMEYGANLAGAARTTGTLNSTGAATVANAARQLDAYKHGTIADFARWEQEIAARL